MLFLRSPLPREAVSASSPFRGAPFCTPFLWGAVSASRASPPGLPLPPRLGGGLWPSASVLLPPFSLSLVARWWFVSFPLCFPGLGSPRCVRCPVVSVPLLSLFLVPCFRVSCLFFCVVGWALPIFPLLLLLLFTIPIRNCVLCYYIVATAGCCLL